MNEGKRVLLLAKVEGKIEDNNLQGFIVPFSLVCLENPIRNGIYKTFNFFESQGVKIKVISGDNPVFVYNVWRYLHRHDVS